MNSILVPVLNKMYVFHKHTLLYLGSGSGVFQVDFHNYDFTWNKILFLAPGQYFQLLSGNFKIWVYEFSDKTLAQVKNSRYLFQHLIGLGYIPSESERHYPSSPLLFLESDKQANDLLEKLVKDWMALNPFHAKPDEVDLLFDIKTTMDYQFPRTLSLLEISKNLDENPFRIDDLTKEKLEHSIQKWNHEKVLLEAKRSIIFTDHSVKEIAYNIGFKDPNYFFRFFKTHTKKTPIEFREGFEWNNLDPFLTELNQLMDYYYKSFHLPSFYAGKMGMSLKTFSRKIDKQFNTSFSRLLQNRLLKESYILIQKKEPFYGIAYDLGFKEPNHFTAFFKKHTGKSPSQFLLNL